MVEIVESYKNEIKTNPEVKQYANKGIDQVDKYIGQLDSLGI